MELICPSCEARYRVPEGAIGAHGRQVSCTNCGHSWHAVPPLVLGAAARTPGPEAEATAGAQSGAPVHASPAEQQFGRAVTADVHGARPSEPGRIAQLAEIREMIAQVQSDDRAPEAHGDRSSAGEPGRASASHAGHGTAPLSPATAAGAARTRPERDGSGEPLHQDPLRRRMAEHDARAARERDERERLRRSMKHRKRETKGGSGAFFSGFLLVVLVAAVLLGTYLMHDEIIIRAPETAPILTEYVDAMDDLRVAIADGYERARAWVMNLIADVA